MSANITESLQAGLQHHQSGRLREAEAAYQAVLNEDPGHPDALHLLGVLALQVGKSDTAVELIEKAIEARPDEAEFYNMCGEAHRARGDFDTAISRFERALALKPDFAGAQNNLGNTYLEHGRLEDAARCYRKAIETDAGFPMAHNNLGLALKGLGQPEKAIGHHERALAIMPNYAEAHTSLGNALHELGRFEEAASHHEQALAIMPDYGEAHSNLGNTLRSLGRLDDAIAHYKRAVAINPKLAIAHYNLGIALDERARPADAAASYEKAIASKPDYAAAHHNLGNALDQLGRREDAIRRYKQAINLRPDYAEAHRNLARISPDIDQAPAIEQMLSGNALADNDAMHFHFALGNIYRNNGDFDRAFEHYNSANALKRSTIDYDAGEYSRYVDRLIAAYSGEFIEEVKEAATDSELPLFILGMPRSGTTLVEQILSSHPDVHGGGELKAFGEFEAEIAKRHGAAEPYPKCIRRVSDTELRGYAERYLGELREQAQGAKRVTDKMPNNFARIGLIRALFPKARIIHCSRDPLDTCVSNYLNYFATGNEFAFDLRELGRYYLDYERLMSHWNKLFPSGVYTVRYEELVADQESVSRALVEHAGLAWDERCLAFHETDRTVHNLSSMQVRQAMYSGSVGLWKRYEKHLDDLKSTLSRKKS